MRSDIVPGVVFPDYELSDHTAKRRKLSQLQGINRNLSFVTPSLAWTSFAPSTQGQVGLFK
jgi:hypothetical protein